MAGLLGGLGTALGLGGPSSSAPAPGALPTGSAIINQDPTNLGPLTTTFVPPPACTVAIAECKTCTDAFIAQTCKGQDPIDITSCWPPTSSGASKPTSTPFGGWGFYSPGIACPAGHASACSATGGAGGGSGWPVQFKLRDGETAVGCCPSGFACANINGQTCIQVATSTTVPSNTCALGSVKTVAGNPATATAMSIYAPMIQINFQRSDLPAPETANELAPAPTDALATAPGEPTPGVKQSVPALDGAPMPTEVSGAGTPLPATEQPGGSRISTGAVVGVGVTGGLALLVVTIAGCIFWQKRIRRQRDAKDAALLKLDSMYEAAKPHDMGGDEYSRYYPQGPQRVPNMEVFSPTPRSPATPGVYQAYRPPPPHAM